MNEVKARMCALTPELATKLLARNTHNRTISSSRIRQYAADMAAGNWAFNGEAIKVSEGGQILDGQHRLRAVIESDVTIIVRTWNTYREGEYIQRLIWNPGGANPDKFPKINGLEVRSSEEPAEVAA